MIFKSSDNGVLEFIGDFEGFYKTEVDAWSQSGKSGEMKSFYELSRNSLNQCLEISFATQLKKTPNELKIAEIGCGTGYSTATIRNRFAHTIIDGFDIAEEAVLRAKNEFPSIDFKVHDILSSALKKKYDVLIISNMIWYVLHDFEVFIENCVHSLSDDTGLLVIHNSFFKSDQKYASDLVNTIGDVRVICQEKIGAPIISTSEFSQSWEGVIYDFGYCSLQIGERKKEA